jgi:hypothetical protein
MDGSAAPGQNSGATADTSTVDTSMIVTVACVYGMVFLGCCLMCARCGLCDCLWCMCKGGVEEPTEETAVCVPEAVTVVYEEQRLSYQGELRGIVVMGTVVHEEQRLSYQGELRGIVVVGVESQ